jgi:hypothetical protein
MPSIDNSAGFDIEQEAFWQAGVESLRRSEEEAYTTQYFRRGRSWLERSVNHPYFGYYPASYYWNKIMPELIRFLVFKPFGVDAPMVGLNAANTVWRSVMTQRENDPELRKWMDDPKNAKQFRALMMLIPATPFDIPVNAPNWIRRIAQGDAENVAREQAGKKPLKLNIAKIAGDSTSYALGPVATALNIADLAGTAVAGAGESMLEGVSGAFDGLSDVFAGTPNPVEEPSRTWSPSP